MSEVYQSVLQGVVDEWAKTPEGHKIVKQCIKDYVDQGGVLYDQNGKQIATPQKIAEICQELINLLTQEADNFFTLSQYSILEHFRSLKYTNPVSTPEGYIAYVYFDDDLWRPSLSDRYDGAYNIIGLFNKGWHINPSKQVWGYWRGRETQSLHKVGSLLDRDPGMFMDRAIEKFNNEIGSKYNVIAIPFEDNTII